MSISACGSQNSSENSGEPATAAPSASGQASTAPTVKTPVKISYLTFRVGTHASARLEEEQIKQFNAKYGDEVEVVVEEIPSDSAYEDKLKILAASGDVPDVVMGKNGINDILIKGNLATPFNDYLDKDRNGRQRSVKRRLLPIPGMERSGRSAIRSRTSVISTTRKCLSRQGSSRRRRGMNL